MKFAAALLALAVGALAASNETNVVYTTQVVTAITTYCPAATEVTYGGSTYTVTEVRAILDGRGERAATGAGAGAGRVPTRANLGRSRTSRTQCLIATPPALLSRSHTHSTNPLKTTPTVKTNPLARPPP